MITEAQGNLLQADADALVNTVNTVGVMGKGIALQFRRAFPEMFEDYKRAVQAGEIDLGRVHVWRSQALTGPRFVINFPTKRHWRAKSRLGDIEQGLNDLVRVIRELDITSIAIPPLGCGQGGLRWSEVEPRIRKAMTRVSEVDVLLYPPEKTPSATAMPTATDRPKMTPGRAALIRILSLYSMRATGVSLIEVQKLMYFLQLAGEPLRLNFTKHIYGPYADNLRHVLNKIEGHYLVGFGDGSQLVQESEPLRVLPGADDEAAGALAEHPETERRIERVLELTGGFESAYGMELLSSVHWVCTHEHADRTAAIEHIRRWTHRKSALFEPAHIEAAWRQLEDHGWLNQELAHADSR
ncbi:macro domain-containing protein [Haloechinothrix sp. LS1_15]|uniref:type II toxin-antitoxin system antitoxin DNA ADP-ribosyl glycohydrolase DarG n=1 Tax=Haloechinothrix sp. LS1_15 TaxID=2652248 RepID=UPI0029480587|nr:macro domain-containing protein [Haloechinothrix sp. LS1_15]MDV6012443.1 macro domain-containing protein [Haloechinothrix sp. LS1_15]